MLVFAHIRQNFFAVFYPRLSEWMAATAVFGIGLVLTFNGDLMATSRTQAYDLMLMIASQRSWAIGMELLGGARLIVLLINGAWRRSPHLRSIMAFLSCFPLCLISLSFAPVFGIALVLCTVFLVGDMINVMRAAGDARIIDDKMKAQDNGGSGRRQSR